MKSRKISTVHEKEKTKINNKQILDIKKLNMKKRYGNNHEMRLKEINDKHIFELRDADRKGREV